MSRCGAMILTHVACVHDDRQHDYERHAPDEADRRECIARRTVAYRHDREAHGKEAIAADHGQRVDPRKHVDTRQHVVDLTHGAAERPMAEQHCRHHERKSDQKEAVGDRQVQDVHVGDGFHLGVPRHDEDDERVSDETHCAYDAEHEHRDDAHRVDDPYLATRPRPVAVRHVQPIGARVSCTHLAE